MPYADASIYLFKFDVRYVCCFGIFSRQPLRETRDAFVSMNEAIQSIGCGFRAPILALSFVALSTIPAYGLTDYGLIDVATQEFVDVVVSTS